MHLVKSHLFICFKCVSCGGHQCPKPPGLQNRVRLIQKHSDIRTNRKRNVVFIRIAKVPTGKGGEKTAVSFHTFLNNLLTLCLHKHYSCLFLTNGKQENHGPLGINILILLVKHQNGNSGNNWEASLKMISKKSKAAGWQKLKRMAQATGQRQLVVCAGTIIIWWFSIICYSYKQKTK